MALRYCRPAGPALEVGGSLPAQRTNTVIDASGELAGATAEGADVHRGFQPDGERLAWTFPVATTSNR